MKLRKVRVTGNTARCLPDDATDFTHEIELTDAEYLKANNDNYFLVEDGTPRQKTDIEKYSEQVLFLEQAELSRIATLEKMAYDYQTSYTGFKCPANFYALLIGAKAAGKLGPKVIACFVALDLLWKLYETYKKDSTIEIEFDVAGVIPHSFDEVRAEIEA